MDCKKALTEAEGDVEQAIEILRVKQGKRIQDRGERIATEGTVQAYIHAGAKVGVLIEVDCKTDFVATQRGLRRLRPRRRDADRRQPHRRATSAARRSPRSATPRRASTSRRPPTSPRTSARRSSRASSTRGIKTIVLLEQEMHNPKLEGKTVQQLRDELSAKTGENVVIRRFARFAVGQ